MAQSCTVSCVRPVEPGQANSIARYKIAWTSASDGTVTATVSVNGCLLRWAFVPAGGGSAPTDNYDMTLSDVASIDVLGGTGANLSTSATKESATGMTFTDGTNNAPVPRAICDELTLAITNAGSGKSGTIYLWTR